MILSEEETSVINAIVDEFIRDEFDECPMNVEDFRQEVFRLIKEGHLFIAHDGDDFWIEESEVWGAMPSLAVH